MWNLKKLLPILPIACSLFVCEGVCGEKSTRKENMKYTLTELEYPVDALEPWIDTETVKIHHGKHQATYVNNLNNILTSNPDFKFEGSLTELVTNLESVPEAIRTAVRNNAGGVWNHEFYWRGLSPEKSHPSDALLLAIKESFGTFENFQKQMSDAALSRFGSGWAWLGVTGEGKLKICSTSNQNSPIMGVSTYPFTIIPILCIDVWEHAYYLKYQNRRADHIGAIWNIINWKRVSQRFDEALSKLKK